ncbi:MAG: Ankyrin repeat [Herminiimonas sp.]|nr:Ankyrin repeat [Herminiimonas sp.]
MDICRSNVGPSRAGALKGLSEDSGAALTLPALSFEVLQKISEKFGLQALYTQLRSAHSPVPMVVAGELLTRSPYAGKAALASALLTAGFDPNHIHVNGRSSLDQAANARNEELIDVLITFGADIDGNRNASGDVALWAALRWDDDEAVALLLAAGADPNIRDHENTLPLSKAITGQITIVNLLLAHGADPNGDSALGHAAARANLGTVKALLAAGANPNQPDPDGNPPLAFLLKGLMQFKTRQAVARLLLDAGANPDQSENGKPSPYDSAAAQFGDKQASLLFRSSAPLILADR